MGNGNSHRQKHRSKRGGAEPAVANAPAADMNAPDMNAPGMNAADMNAPDMNAPGMNAAEKKCCPCPDEKKEEGFFAALNPNKLEEKLVGAQTSAIEGSKNAFNNGLENAKAGLSNKITDFLKPAQEGGRRRTRKHKRSKHKRSKHKRSKHKRSKHKRGTKKRSKSSRR
jgi:hypothetical protein